MDYQELDFQLLTGEDFYLDLYIDLLATIGFESFDQTEKGFKAYVPANQFNDSSLKTILEQYQNEVTFSWQVNFFPGKNWNEEWESNFNPLIIADSCYIRATFHEPRPDLPYEIVIDPKMAFGTGHHQTTTMMIEYLLEEDCKEKVVLDMGCGTGILGILAYKLGAKKITAIDYDLLSYDSTIENANLNNVSSGFEIIQGSKEVIPHQKYDLILANINRNILLDQIEEYAQVLSGKLFISGFYKETDLQMLIEKAKLCNLEFINFKQTDNWVAASFIKQ